MATWSPWAFKSFYLQADSTETGDENKLDVILQRELLKKLNLPPDNPPDWFPGRRNLPSSINTDSSNANIKSDNISGNRLAAPSVEQQWAPEAGVKTEKEAEELFDEDDLLLASAVDNFENLATVTGSDNG